MVAAGMTLYAFFTYRDALAGPRLGFIVLSHAPLALGIAWAVEMGVKQLAWRVGTHICVLIASISIVNLVVRCMLLEGVAIAGTVVSAVLTVCGGILFDAVTARRAN